MPITSVEQGMKEFKSGQMHSGSKAGPTVTNPKQAIAISLNSARKAGAKGVTPPPTRSRSLSKSR